MNKETLYELRSLVALYPYYQTARLLMLQNMYLMHDSAFDDELHRAALYVSDRSLLFEMVEGAHYKIKTAQEIADEKSAISAAQRDNATAGNRTISLIDSYLETAQPDNDNEAQQSKANPLLPMPLSTMWHICSNKRTTTKRRPITRVRN